MGWHHKWGLIQHLQNIVFVPFHHPQPDCEPQSPAVFSLQTPGATTSQQPLALHHKGSSVAFPEILNEKAFVPSKSLVTPVPPAQDSQGKAGGSCGGLCRLALPCSQPSRCFIALCLINISSHVLNEELISAPSSQTAPCLGVHGVGVWMCPGVRVSPRMLKNINNHLMHYFCPYFP